MAESAPSPSARIPDDLDRAKAALLATVSHELRTPLTSILGYAELLIEGLAGPLSDPQREYVRVILEKGEQLRATVTAMLDLQRLRVSGVTLSREPVAVADLVEAAIAPLRPRAIKKGLSLRALIAGEPPALVVDREKLREAVRHLADNAVKFTAPGGEVEVGASHDGHVVRLWVRDTGLGVAPELQARIFETFTQGDGSSTRRYPGTGCGLALVRAYVEAHGGIVSVTSEGIDGQGSTFSITFPT